MTVLLLIMIHSERRATASSGPGPGATKPEKQICLAVVLLWTRPNSILLLPMPNHKRSGHLGTPDLPATPTQSSAKLQNLSWLWSEHHESDDIHSPTYLKLPTLRCEGPGGLTGSFSAYQRFYAS